MAHSISRIWVHAIWGCKNRVPFIKDEIESPVHQLIKNELTELKCPVKVINGMPDHIHTLFLLNPDLTIRKVMQQMKGASSYRINQSGLLKNKLAWQIGFGAFSVSVSVLPQVESYIQNQKEHHKKMTFQEEYEKFMKLHGVLPVKTANPIAK